MLCYFAIIHYMMGGSKLKKLIVLFILLFTIPIITACGKNTNENKYNDLINVLVQTQELYKDDICKENRIITIKGKIRESLSENYSREIKASFFLHTIIITNNAIYSVGSNNDHDRFFFFCEIEYIERKGEIIWKQ